MTLNSLISKERQNLQKLKNGFLHLKNTFPKIHTIFLFFPHRKKFSGSNEPSIESLACIFPEIFNFEILTVLSQVTYACLKKHVLTVFGVQPGGFFTCIGCTGIAACAKMAANLFTIILYGR